jgi:hypothetical protein
VGLSSGCSVPARGSVRSSDYIKVRLFETAYRESHGKAGIYGLIIAHCLANRVRRNMGTWLEVLANVPKYRANEPDPSLEPNLWEPQTQMLLQEVDAIYENAVEDKSNGGIYWCFTEKGANDWFRDFVINTYAVTAMQNGLKVWGEKTVIGKPPDLKMAGW